MRHMKTVLLIQLLVLNILSNVYGQTQGSGKTYSFINGSWFSANGFVKHDFYSSNGVLTAKKPSRIDSIIDLAGKYVVPPFGEAHNHNVEWYGEERFNKLRDRYLKDGIFYIKNPNNLPKVPGQLAGRINTPQSIDVSFSNGSITAPEGHPLGLVKRNIDREVWTVEDAEGGFYYSVDNLKEFYAKWNMLKKTKPGFIKLYLLYSEEYAKRRTDSNFFAWKGLNPAMLKTMIDKIHKDGYRVAVHVETSADFHTALLAGADEINHTPGFRAKADYGFENYKIAEADAKLAAKNKIVVVTTMGTAIDNIFKTIDSLPYKATEKEMIVYNLTLLQKNKVRLAIGSDAYGQTSRFEIDNLRKLNIFDNLTLLKMWCESTAGTIFPGRKIGYLREGYEASFLVLEGNPVEDFKYTERIMMRVKSGLIMKNF